MSASYGFKHIIIFPDMTYGDLYIGNNNSIFHYFKLEYLFINSLCRKGQMRPRQENKSQEPCQLNITLFCTGLSATTEPNSFRLNPIRNEIVLAQCGFIVEPAYPDARPTINQNRERWSAQGGFHRWRGLFRARLWEGGFQGVLSPGWLRAIKDVSDVRECPRHCRLWV